MNGKLFTATIIFLLSGLSILYAYQPCDTVRNCTGNALTIEVTSGRGAQYVDVPMSSSLESIKNAVTIEMWLKPERQAGTVQFIAGIWGPGEDMNDSWVLYFSPDDSLVFEINGANTNLLSLDNTQAKAPAATLFNRWNHIAAVFDGSKQTIYLYINGSLVDSARNNAYPVSALRQTRDKLPLQIGSTNALSNNYNNRTLKGQIDEFKIWNRVLSSFEIYCNLNTSHKGDEANLTAYYRFNQVPWNYDICDASNFNNNGNARSGAKCTPSSRSIQRKFISSISSISDTIVCDTIKSWTITVTDTSICGGSVWMRVLDDLRTSYTITPTTLTLQPNQPQTFTLTLKTNFVGNISSRLQIISTNNCGSSITIPIKLTRASELSFSHSIIDFDTVTAGCRDIPYIDSTFQICNNTLKLGQPRAVTINSITTGFAGTYQIISKTTPFVLQPDECETVTVRFYRGNDTKVYNTNITIQTNDHCNPRVIIPLKGAAFEAVKITSNGTKRLDSINFGTFCIDVASKGVQYYWSNQMKTPVYIDSIIIPENFIGKPLTFPIRLNPQWGYRPNYFRFLPKKQGFFRDSIIFIIRTDECIVERKIYVSGRGFYADLSLESDTLDFGNVVVGRQNTLNAKITNNSLDTLNVRFYLRNGDVFFLTGATSANILPGRTATIPITFSPLTDTLYYDLMCYYETRCGASGCMVLKGRGIIENLLFEPMFLSLENVIGCSSDLDTIRIRNVSGSRQVLSQFNFLDPGGRFSLLEPAVLPVDISLENNQFAEFVFRYTPNDVINEHADRAYLQFRTNDNINWSAKLFGSSLIPKLYLTEVKKYGIIEVGDAKRDTLIIENISPFPIYIDSLSIPNGFILRYPSITIQRYLQPGDTINLILDFAPTQPGEYKDNVKVYASQPCDISNTGNVSGEAIIVPLEIPISVISFGFAKPCECIIRKLPLINRSQAFEMNIDSIWIDDIGVSNPFPEFFSWTSFYSPSGTLPYQIPPMSFDTVIISFCPRTPALRRYVDMGAKIHIRASGSGWNREYATFLIGKRSLVFEPERDTVSFPPTRVDTFSVSQYNNLYIPDFGVNPERADLKLDSVTFEPDERVFYISDSLNRPFPISIDSTTYIPLKVDFKPRAVRPYSARMTLHFSNPCYFTDTTILVNGIGFAPAFGLNLSFNNNISQPDTFRLINCDTLLIPIYTTRDIPAKVIDVQCFLNYDTTKLEYIGIRSPYQLDSCDGFPTAMSVFDYDMTNKIIKGKNLCLVDSIRPIFILSFVAKSTERDTFKIKIDSITFDTQDVLLYNLLAGGSEALIIIQKPEITILNDIDFGTIQVLDCISDTLIVINSGDVPITINELLPLPLGVTVVAAIPSLNTYINVGDTAVIVLQYCPRKKDTINNSIETISYAPCIISDSTTIQGISYAQPFDFVTDISYNFATVDTVRASIGDTINIPIIVSEDFSAVIGGSFYSLQDFSFDVLFAYNPYSIKLLDIQSSIPGVFSFNYNHGSIEMYYKSINDLRAGEIASLTFLVSVPDSIVSSIYINSYNFRTDSIMFIDITPIPSNAMIEIDGKCSITYMQHSDVTPSLSVNSPNPWSDKTSIGFSINEKAPVKLSIYNSLGQMIYQPLDGKRTFEPGTYKVEINSKIMESGVYIYMIEAGTFTDSKTMNLIK